MEGSYNLQNITNFNILNGSDHQKFDTCKQSLGQPRELNNSEDCELPPLYINEYVQVREKDIDHKLFPEIDLDKNILEELNIFDEDPPTEKPPIQNKPTAPAKLVICKPITCKQYFFCQFNKYFTYNKNGTYKKVAFGPNGPGTNAQQVMDKYSVINEKYDKKYHEELKKPAGCCKKKTENPDQNLPYWNLKKSMVAAQRPLFWACFWRFFQNMCDLVAPLIMKQYLDELKGRN